MAYTTQSSKPPPKKKTLHVVLFDVSGSMQAPLKLRSNAEESNKCSGDLEPKRVQTVLDVMCRLAEDGIAEAKDQDIYVAVLCFGLRDVNTCDLLAFLEQRIKVLELLDEAENQSTSELPHGEAVALLVQHGLNEQYLMVVGRSALSGEDLYRVVGRKPLIDLLTRAGAPFCEKYVNDYVSDDEAGKYFMAFASHDRAPQLRMIIDQLPLACKDYLAHMAESRTLGRTGEIGQGIRRSSTSEATGLADKLIAGSSKDATKEELLLLLKSITSATPRPLYRVIQLVKRLQLALKQDQTQDHTTGESGPSSQESHPAAINWERLLDHIEPYLYGATPMCEALRSVQSDFQEQTYSSKVMILISDGEATDGDPLPLAKALREAGGIIFTCLLTDSEYRPRRWSNPFRPKSFQNILKNGKGKGKGKEISTIEEPRRLRGPNEIDPDWPRAARAMFKMASTVSYDSGPVQALRRRGWKLPVSGMCKLFIQANDSMIIDEFTAASRHFSTSSDALADLIGQISLDKYTQKSNDGAAATDQGARGICWAHATASVFHFASSRIVGRTVPDFLQIRSHLLAVFAENSEGQNVEYVLRQTCPSYSLRWKGCSEGGARAAIHARRPVIATFGLDSNHWDRFSTFYKHFPKKTLTAQDMKTAASGKQGGHAVVLVRCDETSLTFMNSWGINFGNNGFFTIDKASTLENTGGPRMQFYDVYWTMDDLSTKEVKAWKDHEIQTGCNIINALPMSFHDLPVSCPHCKQTAPARQYDGSWHEARCRACRRTFKPTAKALLQSLYDSGYD